MSFPSRFNIGKVTWTTFDTNVSGVVIQSLISINSSGSFVGQASYRSLNDYKYIRNTKNANFIVTNFSHSNDEIFIDVYDTINGNSLNNSYLDTEAIYIDFNYFQRL